MKRDIFFCATLARGGAERVVSVLASELAQKGENIEIVVYFDRDIFYQIDERVTITSVEKATKSRNLIRNLLWMRNYFRENARMVCSFISSFNMLALLATRGLGIPVVVSERTDPMRKNWFYRWTRDCLYGFADAIVTQTQISRRYFASKLKTRCVTIYNPISPILEIGGALIAKKQPVIVSVGRLEHVKNQALLIKAFKKVTGRFPRYKLVIYGEGPCRKKLEQLRDELGLHDGVELPGEMENIFERISSSEIFVLSSNFEGMPNALLEAMCLGLPVISTKVSGALEVIKEGENGLLVNIGDEMGLANTLSNLLENESFRQTLAKNAVKMAADLNSASIVSVWGEIFDAAIRDYK